MAGFGDALKSELPALVLGILAGRTGGLPAVSAFQGGRLQRQQADRERNRQAMLDEERRQGIAAQEARMAGVDARAQGAEARAVEDQRLQKIQAALAYLHGKQQQIGETATDATAAENALLARSASAESLFNVPQGQLSSAVPNMAPAITRGLRADARQLMTDAEARASKVNAAYDDSSVTFQWELASPRIQRYLVEAGHPEGQPFKPSQIQNIAGSPLVTPGTKPDVPNTTEERAEAAIKRGDTAELARIRQAAELVSGARRRPEDQELTDINRQLAELRLAAAQAPKKPDEPNQAQFTASAYAGRMAQAEPILTQVEPTIVKMGLPAYELQTNSWFAKPTFQSKDVQSYMQAARNFINAVLRRESGAVISPSEFAEARQQYLPQPGDTTEALANKKANREYVFSTMKRASGTAYEPPLAALPPLTKDSVPGEIYMHNGKKVKVREKTRTGFLFDEVTD